MRLLSYDRNVATVNVVSLDEINAFRKIKKDYAPRSIPH